MVQTRGFDEHEGIEAMVSNEGQVEKSQKLLLAYQRALKLLSDGVERSIVRFSFFSLDWSGILAILNLYPYSMGRYAVIISGPAGSGKTTLSNALIAHANTVGRNVHLVNLDPAAENFTYPPSIDIRDLISLEDVMEELKLGPNGGLVYCFEYLLENLDWLEDQLGSFEDDYLIIDCPGQIELYTHTPLVQRILSYLSISHNFRLCQLYLLESHFVDDVGKYFAGTLSAMSAMINLEVPWINVLSKMDLVERGETGGKLAGGLRGKRELER